MTTLNILSGGAAHGLVASLASTFKELTGLDIAGEFGAVGAMADKLRSGTSADIVILTAAIIAKLAEENLVFPASTSNIGLVETAIAVRAGDPQVTVRDPAHCALPSLRRCDLHSRHQGVDGRNSCRESIGTTWHRRRSRRPVEGFSEWRDRDAPSGRNRALSPRSDARNRPKSSVPKA